MYAKQHLDKPEAFWKQVLQNEEVKKKKTLWPQSSEVDVEKTGAAFAEKKTLLSVTHGSGSVICGSQWHQKHYTGRWKNRF